MSAPILWIIIPGVSAIILYIFRRYQRMVKLAGITIALLMAVFAWLIPIGSPISLGPWPALPTLLISDHLTILGRNLILGDPARSTIIIIYLGAVLWFVGSAVVPITRLFIPLGLAMASLLTAAISVEPFLYAALFIELAVLLSIPLLSPPGQPVSRGVLRFLIYQTLGMFILLFASWMVQEVELNANNPVLAIRATSVLSLGLALTLSIFPFSVWIPMVTKKSNPYSTAFIIFTLSEIITLFALNIFSRYNWLQSSPSTVLWFSLVGLFMVVGGGVLAIYQSNLGRVFGYAVVAEIGLIVVSIGQISAATKPGGQLGDSIISQIPLAALFFALILPRGLNLAIWALGLTIIKNKTQNLEIESIIGFGYHFPIATAGITLACLSLASYPMLAGFPVRAALGAGIAQISPVAAGFTLVGYFALVIAALRNLSFLLARNDTPTWKVTETIPQIVLLAMGIVLLLIVGVFPQIFLRGLQIITP